MKKDVGVSILAIWIILTIPISVAQENLDIYGLNNCEKVYRTEIGDFKPNFNYIFLITGYRIEYHGQNSVSIDPNFFSIQIGSSIYHNSGATYNLNQISKTYLPSMTLTSGGSVEGYIAYEIPVDQKDKEFNISYSGFEGVIPNYRCG